MSNNSNLMIGDLSITETNKQSVFADISLQNPSDSTNTGLINETNDAVSYENVDLFTGCESSGKNQAEEWEKSHAAIQVTKRGQIIFHNINKHMFIFPNNCS